MCRLVGDHGEAKYRNHAKDELSKEIVLVRSVFNGDVDKMMIKQLGEKMKVTKGQLLDIPFHILELIAKHFVAVDRLPEFSCYL